MGVLLALVIGASAACGSPAPSASAQTPVGSVAPTAAGPPAISPCGPTEIDVRATDAGGAAGSRGADVAVTARGEAVCRLTPRPLVGILDATGRVVLQTLIEVEGEGPLVSASSPASFTYEVSNWCSPTTSTPWSVVLATPVGSVPIGGIRYEAADLPPCNGPGEPATLTTSTWTSHPSPS